MALPRPSSPKAVWSDLKAFAGDRRPHHWIGAGLAILMPVALIVLFLTDGRTNTAPKAQLIYVESWPATRTDAEIIADQKKRAAANAKAKKEQQEQFRRLDERLEKAGL